MNFELDLKSKTYYYMDLLKDKKTRGRHGFDGDKRSCSGIPRFLQASLKSRKKINADNYEYALAA